MGSKTARARGGSKGGGMGPGQSMAMAGNTGLASFSEADINKVQQAKRQFEKATGRDTPSSYADIGREIGELGSKYRRPVQINPSLGAFSDDSGRMYTPSDFDARGNMMAFTATPPTLGQMFGDMGRAVTGYNSLQYPAGANVPVMSRTRGLAEVLAKVAIPGSIGMNIARDLFSRFFPGQEEEETATDPRIVSGAYDALRRSNADRGFAPEGFTFPTDIQREVGPTVDLRKPTIEEMETIPITETGAIPIIESGDTTKPGPTIADYLSAGYGGQRISPEQQDLIDEFMEADERLQKRDTAEEVQGPSPQYLTDVESAFMYPKDYTIPFTDIQIPSLGNAIESAVTSGQGFDAGQNLTPAGEAVYDRLVEEFNFSPEDALERIKVLNNAGVKNTSVGALFADGGLTTTVPPKEGPMSAGVASLFKNK